MKSFDDMTFHPDSEKLVSILCAKTQNTDPSFSRVLVAYYMSLVASMMRCRIKTLDRGTLPVNMYAINLGPSGMGKGYSTNIMEEEVLHKFRERFAKDTFPYAAELQLPKLANERAIRKNVDPDEELEKVRKEFIMQGEFLFSFDSATVPALKQARHKLLMAEAGALNLQIDEIGSNLTSNVELLTSYLELFDVGNIKQKLVKNTAENLRSEQIHGRTPTNMLLFGTPAKLFNGSKVEEEYYSMLETGYARRCFFGYVTGHARDITLSPQEVFARRTDTNTSQFMDSMALQLFDVGDQLNLNKLVLISEKVTLLLIEYQLHCEKLAEALPEHEEMRKAEVAHRYFKALKLAGVYAFIEGAAEITEDHLYYAIKLAEESGKSFSKQLARDRPYVKLAKYIASVGRNTTQADLVEDLPFYRGSTSQKQEMMQLAIAYGYQNNILIKKTFDDGIEFFRGETLKATDLDNLTVSYSTDLAKGYHNDTAKFSQLDMMTKAQDIHWVNHHLVDGHRKEDNVISGFDMVVIDVDHGVPIETAKALLKEYTYLIYETKRHTATENRYRIILPSNFRLRLAASEFKEFMNSLYDWLPFEVDRQTDQRSRKWLSSQGTHHVNHGELLDVLPFIPKTSKNEARKRLLTDQQSLDNLERWVINHSGDGNRNNQLLKYALLLVDSGFSFDEVRNKVTTLNGKMPDKLSEAEIIGTIMVTAGKKLAERTD